MRDGLHRTLPLPRHWRAFFRTCGRQAGRARSTILLKKAFAQDFRWLTRSVQQELRTRIGQATPLLPGLPALGPDLTYDGIDRAEECLRRATRLLNSDAPPRDPVDAALLEMLEANRWACQRLMEEHLAKQGPRANSEIQDLRKRLDGLQCQEILQEILDGQEPAETELNIEEDLREPD